MTHERAEAHEHTEECASLFREWLRYHLVVIDESGRLSPDERRAAVRERDMFRRQLDGLGCDPAALLAQEAALAGDEDPGSRGGTGSHA
ncbi:MAG: hypothetical protein WC273_00995 [Dehalococcoidia bacterium]